MSTAQKMVAALGLAAIGVTCLAAPFRYTAANLDGGVRSGLAFRPIFAGPADYDLAPDSMQPSSTDGRAILTIRGARLDTGLLGIEWAAIAIVCAGLVALLSKGARSASATVPSSSPS